MEDRLSSARRLVANGHGGGKKKLSSNRVCVRLLCVEGLTVVKELHTKSLSEILIGLVVFSDGVEFARLFQVYHVGQQGQQVDCVSLCCVT